MLSRKCEGYSRIPFQSGALVVCDLLTCYVRCSTLPKPDAWKSSTTEKNAETLNYVLLGHSRSNSRESPSRSGKIVVSETPQVRKSLRTFPANFLSMMIRNKIPGCEAATVMSPFWSRPWIVKRLLCTASLRETWMGSTAIGNSDRSSSRGDSGRYPAAWGSLLRTTESVLHTT